MSKTTETKQNTETTAPHQPEDIFSRMCSVFGHTVDRKLVARLVAADTADKKRLAKIEQLGTTGVRQMFAEQEAAIVKAAERGDALPHAVRTHPDMVHVVEEQMAALKNDRAAKNAGCWPDITEAWRAFVATVSPKIDVLEDGEKELADRLGIAFEPSATLRALRHALAVAEAHALPPKNPTRLNGSPLACLAGLVQV